MVDDEGVLRRVAWTELFPWLILVRSFRLAIRFRALVLAAAAILATLSGWALLGLIFAGSDPVIAREIRPFERCPWLALTALVPDRPLGEDRATVGLDDVLGTPTPVPIFIRAWNPLVGSWEQLSRPFREIFSQGIMPSRAAFLLFCGLWTLAVWGFFGGAITRFAVVELAAGERIGWGAMLRYAGSRWRSYVGAPLMPLLAALMATLLTALVGLLLRFDIGVLVAALLWPLVLLGWLLIALWLLGLLFGWPLMWAVISAEGTDSFGALSRSSNYLFSRPLHALFYALVAVALGILGWLLVSNFAAAVIGLSYWSAGWGAGPQAVASIQAGEGLGAVGAAGAGLLRFWVECVKLLAVGFLYSYLWTTAVGIYLLLRRDVDAREMDEVFLEDDVPQEVYGLPPLKTDPSGVPDVADEPP